MPLVRAKVLLRPSSENLTLFPFLSGLGGGAEPTPPSEVCGGVRGEGEEEEGRSSEMPESLSLFL